jgi:DNA-binding MltR family transcriptional regulator
VENNMNKDERALMHYKVLSESIDLDKIKDLPIKEVFQFRCSLSEETDRGCALMAAAFLDFELSRLLEARLVDNSKIFKTLSSNNGPLSSFSSKIDIAYMFGLLSENARKDLHILRKIRNEFAHKHECINFENDEIAHRCNELKLKNTPEGVRSRLKFTNAMMGVASEIHTTIYKSQKIKPKENIDLEKLKVTSLELALKTFDKIDIEFEKYHSHNKKMKADD